MVGGSGGRWVMPPMGITHLPMMGRCMSMGLWVYRALRIRRFAGRCCYAGHCMACVAAMSHSRRFKTLFCAIKCVAD